MLVLSALPVISNFIGATIAQTEILGAGCISDSGVAGGDAGLLGIARARRFAQANCTRIYHGHFDCRDRRRNSA